VSLAILILVGAFVTPSTGNRLSEPGEIGPFIGTSAQMLGLITAIVTGIVATVQNCRTLFTRRESGERFPDRRVVQASQVTARLLSKEEMRRCAKSSKRRPARRQKQGGT
jgi:hypothetical protein